MLRYQAVFFDLGGTLVYRVCSQEERFLRIAQELNIPIPSTLLLKQGIQAGLRVFSRWVDKIRTLEEEKALRLKRIEIILSIASPGTEKYAQRFLQEEQDFVRWWQLYEDVLPVLTWLRGKALLGLITNWLPSLPLFCQALGLGDFFDYTINSVEVGISKPDPRVFQIALGYAQMAPKQAVHVGDSYEADVKGALNAGLNAVLLDRRYAYLPLEVPILSSLTDLLPLVRVSDS